MPYWVYGRDSSTGQPSEPFFCDAESEEDARKQANAAGISSEEVEEVKGRADPPLSESLPSRTFQGVPVGQGVSRGVIWLSAGVILIVVSYVVSLAESDYIMSGTVRQALGRAHRLNWLGTLARLGLYAGIVAAAAGGIMWIVDTAPERRDR